MAEANKDEATIEVPDDGVVVISVDEEVAAAADESAGAKAGVAAATTETEPPVKPEKRTRHKASEDAAAALDQATQFLEQEKAGREEERKRREAAEATAQSERNAREEAERAAHRSAQEAKGYRDQSEEDRLGSINSGLENAQQRMLAAKQELRRAHEAAEFDKLADAQEQIALAAADIRKFGDQKQALETSTKKTGTFEGGRVEAPAPPQPSSAFEKFVRPFTPRSQAFLRAHPDFVPGAVGGDDTKNARMMAGHYDAVARKVALDSDEYFKIIEEATGLRTPETKPSPLSGASETTKQEVVPQPAQRRPAPLPSAPPSRDVPTGGAAGGARVSRTVTLSRDQQDAAKISFPHLSTQQAFAEYAKNLLELEAEGKMGRLTH